MSGQQGVVTTCEASWTAAIVAHLEIAGSGGLRYPSRRAGPATVLARHDYPAAGSYLSLFYDEPAAARYVKRLRQEPMSKFKARDIFRASGLSLLGISNSHVEHDRKKILAGKSLSPLLLVRAPNNQRVIIADGYHRMCAVYSFDEDALIPCKIV